MSPFDIGVLAIGALAVLILIGMPIGIGMLAVSLAGVAAIRNDTVAGRMMTQVANDSLEEYLFAVVPLFVLMGLLVTVSGVGKDTFGVFQRLLNRVTAGLGVATVFANAVFAAITGISIILLIVALGCLIDSISIMLIMLIMLIVLPIALPVTEAAGHDLIWFGVVTVIAVEIGLLTPPFGLSVYTIKSAMDDPDLKVGEIFRGAVPFIGAMLATLAVIVLFPVIATWLARI